MQHYIVLCVCPPNLPARAACGCLTLQINPEARHENPGMFNLLFGAYGFPVGLSLCVINGASLFTSNIAYMMAAFIERKATPLQSLWVVWLSYFSNLAGALSWGGYFGRHGVEPRVTPSPRNPQGQLSLLVVACAARVWLWLWPNGAWS